MKQNALGRPIGPIDRVPYIKRTKFAMLDLLCKLIQTVVP